VNESFNNTASWLALKNKVYCGSRSLSNRLAIAAGVTSTGFSQYFERLFKVLGISMTLNVAYFLQHKEYKRSTRLATIKTKAHKKKRLKQKHAQLKADEKVAKKSRDKQMLVVYKTGINMKDDDEEIPIAMPKKKTAMVCPH
jgi:predicted small secreted protein